MKSNSKAGGLLGGKGARFSAEIQAELFNRAEKELAAFVAAVNTLYGEEQARAAADDWLLELIALKEPFNVASLDLRSVTIGAAICLARRLSIPSPARAVLAAMVGILLLAAPADAHAAHSNSRHPSYSREARKPGCDSCRAVSGTHELSKIPTIGAKISTTPDAMCGLLTVLSRRVGSIGQN